MNSTNEAKDHITISEIVDMAKAYDVERLHYEGFYCINYYSHGRINLQGNFQDVNILAVEWDEHFTHILKNNGETYYSHERNDVKITIVDINGCLDN